MNPNQIPKISPYIRNGKAIAIKPMTAKLAYLMKTASLVSAVAGKSGMLKRIGKAALPGAAIGAAGGAVAGGSSDNGSAIGGALKGAIGGAALTGGIRAGRIAARLPAAKSIVGQTAKTTSKAIIHNGDGLKPIKDYHVR
jgi:hypothetical protein